AAGALDAHLEAVEHVLAGLGEDPGEGTHVADLDRLGGGRRGCRQHEREQREREGPGDHGPHSSTSDGRVEGRWTGKRRWTSSAGARRSPRSWAGPSASSVSTTAA